MRLFFGATKIVAAVAFAGAVSAQDASESQVEAADSGVEESGLSMGVEEGAVPAGPIVRATYGDWELRCLNAPGQGEVCQLYQLMKDQAGNSVAEFNIFPLPEGQQAVAGANIVVPLETLLTANLRLSVDGGTAKRYPYSFCSRVGCFARIGLTGDELNLFRRGASGTISLVNAAAPSAPVEATLSLTGFTAGYAALVETEAARGE